MLDKPAKDDNYSQIIRYLLTTLDLFKGCPETDLDFLSLRVRIIDLPSRHLLVKQGEDVGAMYAVLEGSLKIYMLSCDGQHRVARLVTKGDTFGEDLIVNLNPSPVCIETIARSRLLVLPKESTLTLLERSHEASRAMNRVLGRIAEQFLFNLQISCLTHAQQRMAQYLSLLEPGVENGGHLKLPAPKAMVASLLNLSPETFSRTLRQLEQAGAITLKDRKIVLLDRRILHTIAAGH